MNEKSLRVLEYNKIIDKLKSYAVTASGKEKISELTPYNSAYEARESLKSTKEGVDIIIKKGNPPFEGIHDTREGIERAKKGGTLSPAQLLYIGNMLRCTENIKEFLSGDKEIECPKLQDISGILVPIPNLKSQIEKAIVSEEEISDKASGALFGIRKSIKELNSSVREKINSIVRSQAKYLQDPIYTMRGDRYVLPVKAEYKGAVQGLVHDQSSTGATLFIEPMSLVKLNNDIKELKLKEQAEIEKILLELSLKVKDNSTLCLSNIKILTEIDFIFAKAKYSLTIDGTMPEVTEDGSFNLLSARHPLIDKEIVVSSDVYLGDNFNVLMITGPNTGGKTVTLKSVGLIHLIGLSGIMIPAKSGSTISFYKEIFADIGDEQSIEQSLSTFSSHMKNIIEILKTADRDSLILFDELGAGTDPTEGAALAIAIIETLKKRNSKIIATTHYSELKGYALRTEEVENASVEFDVNTLRPLYSLIIGIPGKSNAFEISKRLGLDQSVIDIARNNVSDENLKFEDLIRQLQEKSITANKNAREAKILKIEAQKLKNEYSDKLKKLETVRDKAYNDARQQAKDIISTAKDEADQILKDMRELENMGLGTGARAKLEIERKKLKESLEEKEKSLIKERENKGEVLKNIKPGIEAFLPSLNQKVIIISGPDSKGMVQVEAGIMKINVKADELRTSKETKEIKAKKRREVKLNMKQVESRVDLRGLDAQEAVYKTDKYLDEAYLSNLGEVTVVHGKGTGVLRSTINTMLKRHPHVKSYRLGEYGEGGDGVTIVELK